MTRFVDLTGQKFGRLTVVSREANTKLGHTRWKCLCDCGLDTTVHSSRLKDGGTKSCGCLLLDTLKARAKDLSGVRFGRLTATSRSGDVGRRIKWECLCDCGVKAVVLAENLMSDHTKSCGCYKEEVLGKATITHGQSSTNTYRIWAGMIYRCLDTNSPKYPDYGGRGVTVSESWRKFENFHADMGERPEGLTLDRVDNNGNYCKENCRWATLLEQARNKRSNVWYVIGGEKVLVTDFAAKLCVTRSSISGGGKKVSLMSR